MNAENALDVYRSMVRRVIREHLTVAMDNSSAQHATVLIDELIRSAEHSVDVYCKALSPDVWSAPSVVDAIHHAIDSGVQFRVATKEIPARSEALSCLLSYQNASFRMYAQEGLTSNFLIVDKTAFRVEPDDSKREGFAYANNEGMAKSANGIFDSIWNQALVVGAEKLRGLAK